MIISAVLVHDSTGWKRVIACVDLVLFAVPFVIAFIGGLLLSTRGLAWRSCVKLPCGLMIVGGILILLTWAAIYLWQSTTWWKSAIRFFGLAAISIGFVVLGAIVGWYGLLFAAIWSGSDTVVETTDGIKMVREQPWMDYEYYDYCNFFVRGNQVTYEWELLSVPNENNRRAREMILEYLDLSGDYDTVEFFDDTHGGFHNDGETCIQLRYRIDPPQHQIRTSEDWQSLPASEDLQKLLQASVQHDENLEQALAAENGYFWFTDRHTDAVDKRNAEAALARGSFNYVFAIYDADDATIYFFKVDT